jgi:transposase, IS30 family
MDLVVGKQGGIGVVLLMLTERSTQEEIIRKIPDKTQESIQQALDKLERQQKKKFYELFKTVTVDNESEFLNSKALERSFRELGIKRFKLYYANTYSSM